MRLDYALFLPEMQMVCDVARTPPTKNPSIRKCGNQLCSLYSNPTKTQLYSQIRRVNRPLKEGRGEQLYAFARYNYCPGIQVVYDSLYQ